MSVTSTSIGTYTTQLTVAGEKGNAAFITALKAAIVVGAYWALYDEVLNNANGAVLVYRSLNKDATSYKYAMVSVDGLKQRVFLTGYESWDATNHVGKNPTFTLYGSFWLPYAYSNADFVVFAGPRWLGFLGYVNNIPAPFPCFVFETVREHAEDTAANGVPCWAWVAPDLFARGFPHSASPNESYLHSYPRSRKGRLGRDAALASAIFTPHGSARGTGGSVGSNFPVVSTWPWGVAVYTTLNADAWDANVVYAYTPVFGHDGSEIMGRCYALKCTKLTGSSFMNRIAVPVDGDLFYSAGGASTEHWVLPTMNAYGAISPTGYNTVRQTVTGTMTDIVCEGDFWYYTTTTGIYKMSVATYAITVLDNSAGTKQGICYNGQYLWVCDTTNNKVCRIDMATDVVTWSAALTGGGATPYSIAHDGTNLWVLHNTAVASVVYVTKVDPATLAVAATVSIPLNYVGAKIMADPAGNVMALLTSTPNVQVIKINTASNTAYPGSAFLSNPAGTGIAVATHMSWQGVPGKACLIWGSTTTTISNHFAEMEYGTAYVGAGIACIQSVSGGYSYGGGAYAGLFMLPSTAANQYWAAMKYSPAVAQGGSNTGMILSTHGCWHFGWCMIGNATSSIYMVDSNVLHPAHASSAVSLIPK